MKQVSPKKLLIWAATLTAIITFFIAYPWKPTWILWKASFLERKGEEGERNGQQVRDELIACGKDSIKPVVLEIRNGNIWSRGIGAYLPQVLEKLGEPAHIELLKTIDSETEKKSLTALVYALQIGFRDFSRLDRWIEDAKAGNISEYQMKHMALGVAYSFREAPELLSEGKLSSDFLTWWKTNSNLQTNL